jgi:hypothetical protein
MTESKTNSKEGNNEDDYDVKDSSFMVIEDVMSRLFRLGDECTLTTMYERFMLRITEFSPINHYVFVFDKIEYKPKRPKHRPTATVQPLPSGIELCPEGYYDPQRGETSVDARPLPLMALLANRELQIKLAAFLMNTAQADQRLADWHLYWDWTDQAYYLHQHQLIPMTGNQLGEADLAVIWWAHHWRHRPVIISSVDSDVFLLAIVHAQSFHPASVVHRQSQYWSLATICQQMEAVNYSTRSLMAGFILSGTDYVSKGDLLRRVNDTLIARATHKLIDQRGQASKLATTDDWRHLILGIRTQARMPPSYHKSFAGLVVQKPIRRCGKQSAVVWGRLEAVQWQYWYWLTLHGCWDAKTLQPSSRIESNKVGTCEGLSATHTLKLVKKS